MSGMTVSAMQEKIQQGAVQDRSLKPVSPSLENSLKTLGEKNFLELLKESIDRTNQHQVQADRAIKETLAGRNKNIHETLLTLEKADLSFRTLLQVRNKILDAYKEIMRMQV